MSKEIELLKLVSGEDVYNESHPPRVTEFRKELEDLINRHSMEHGSNTPDFILADYLTACLAAFDAASRQREKWYRRSLVPGQSNT